MGAAAATTGAAAVRDAISRAGAATIILATGTSQLDMLDSLVRAHGIDWPKVTCFHLDEYVGLPSTHEASFRRYLQERFVDRLSGVKAFHRINGEAPDPIAETARLDRLSAAAHVDVAFLGIGENGHLAFNDPPADFDTDKPYLIVTLDEACRRQQQGEGWFDSFDDVPRQAITMSIRQILRSRKLVVTVPDARKAKAVQHAVEGELTNRVPASILRTHADCSLFLDPESSKLLKD
ncbi:MAG: glucosamine-6-phosphate deaminase [Alphaproteobacteria bacterium]